MQQLDVALVRRVLDLAPEGIAICDTGAPDHPVIYVNAAFENLTGYSATDVVGSNLCLLLGSDQDQEGAQRLREALALGEECRVLLRICHKSGELLWHELHVQPMRDGNGLLTHHVAYFRDTGARARGVRAPDGLPNWLREDRVTGLSSRAWFNELLAREWRIARRDSQPLTLVLFNIDALNSYSETYGRAAGDALVRRIAGSIAAVFRRGSDVVGVWSEGCIAVLAVHRDGMGVDSIVAHAAATVRRVAGMHIHHPRSTLHRFVTVTGGLATVTPGRSEEAPERLIERAQHALLEGKRDMRGGLNHAPD